MGNHSILKRTFFMFTRDKITWGKWLGLWSPFNLGLNLDFAVTINFGSEPPLPHL